MFFPRIGGLRADREKTQKEIADQLCMNLQVYRRYEKGEREIPAWAVAKLAAYYGTSADYLLGLTDDPALPHA